MEHETLAMNRLEWKQLLDACTERMASIFKEEVRGVVRRELADAGLAKTYIRKTEAYVRYGRAAIDRWIKGGYLRQIKEGGSKSCSCRISIADLEKCASQFNHPARMPNRRGKKIDSEKHS